MNDILESFEDEVKFLIPFLFLYVDDNMTALPETEIDNCLKTLNDIDDKIRFTCEIENNNSLPFLDLLLVRSDDKVLTDLYSSAGKRFGSMFGTHGHSQPQRLSDQMFDH